MSERRKPVRRLGPTVPHRLPGFGSPERGDDPELDAVVDAILANGDSQERFADVFRSTYDQLYDGQHTGRWSPAQLSKTEKTHMGTLVEINVQRAFAFDDGESMDYSIAGIDVDCKFSQRLGGWMLPREAYTKQHLCLVTWADEAANRWEVGVVRALDDPILLGNENQDRKRTLTAAGESRVRWLYDSPVLPENLLFHIDAGVRARIFEPEPKRKASGQARTNMLFRLVQRRLVNRASLLTVAQQDDSPKRARDARLPKHLGREGILVLGHQESDPLVAAALGLPVPSKGAFVSARVFPAESDWAGAFAEIAGGRWRLAAADDPVVAAPLLGRVSRKLS